MADEKRIKVQRVAAAMLRISASRLREHQRSPWWRDEFRTEDGYDVCEILRAQLTYNREDSGALSQEERDKLAADKARTAASHLSVKEQREQATLRRQLREEARDLGLTLPADVYAEFIRELLSMARHTIEAIPFEFSRSVPKQMKKHCYVAKGKPAALQKLVTKKLGRIAQWLTDGETELKQS